MSFITKVDFSNNRQIKQYEKLETSLSGSTQFGLPYSSLTTGPDLVTTAVTSTYTGLTSYFSGNSATTVFYWYNPNMIIAESQLSAITQSNSGITQNTGVVFEPNLTATTVDGYIYAVTYSGLSFDITPVSVTDLGGGSYSGELITNLLSFYSAGTIDYSGRTIWVDVSGITRTEDLIISKSPVIGYVWTCVNSEGKGGWSAAGSGLSYWSASTSGPPTNGIVTVYSNSIASGAYSTAIGFQTQAIGNFSHSEGLQTIANDSGTHAEGVQTFANRLGSHAEGKETQAIGNSSHAQNELNIAEGNNSHAGGLNSIASGETSFVHGENSLALEKSTIVLGDNITGSSANHTYVEGLNIGSIGPSPSIIDLGVDANGYVVDTASDINLKKNIITIDSALEKVINLRGVYFNWKDTDSGGEDRKIGFIAQEVEGVVPELVHTHKNGLKAVNYKDVTPLLVEAIKEIISGETITRQTFLETQKILAEDNNIELNYAGNKETANGGGLIVLHAIDDGQHAELITNEDGNWITNNSLIPKEIIIPEFTPTNTLDERGTLGSMTRDDDYIYIKTKNGWKRSNLDEF
jgi:hypothetical protein